MKFLIYFVFLTVVCGLSVGLAPVLRVGGQSPNLLFLLSVLWAQHKESKDFWFFALFGGLAMDFFSGSVPGSFSIPLLLVCLAVHLLAKRTLVLESNWKYLILVLLPVQAFWFFGFLLISWFYFRIGATSYWPGLMGNLSGFGILAAYHLLFLLPMAAFTRMVRSLLDRYILLESRSL